MRQAQKNENNAAFLVKLTAAAIAGTSVHFHAWGVLVGLLVYFGLYLAGV